jgi:hypothetical protein
MTNSYEVTFVKISPAVEPIVVSYRVNAPSRPLANRIAWRRFNRDYLGYFDGLIVRAKCIDETTEKP